MNTHYVFVQAMLILSKQGYKIDPVNYHDHLVAVSYPDKDQTLVEVCQLSFWTGTINVITKIDGRTKEFGKISAQAGAENILISYIKKCKESLIDKEYYHPFSLANDVTIGVRILKGTADIDLNGHSVSLEILKKIRDAYCTLGTTEVCLVGDKGKVSKEDLDKVIEYTDKKLFELTKV
jgi:hypothetical protein